MKFLFCSALMACVSCACFGANVLEIEGQLQVGSNYIDFGNSLSSGGSFEPAPASGIFQVTSVASGSIFATGGVMSSGLGAIQSLNEGTGTVTLPGAFMTFTGLNSSLNMTATNIPAGPVGPFTLTDTSQGALATFEVLGYIGSDPSANPFAAEFSIGFPGYTVAQLFNALPVDEEYCGVVATSGSPTACNPFPTTSSSTPEPNYVLALSAGLVAAAVVGKRRAARK